MTEPKLEHFSGFETVESRLANELSKAIFTASEEKADKALSLITQAVQKASPKLQIEWKEAIEAVLPSLNNERNEASQKGWMQKVDMYNALIIGLERILKDLDL